MRFIGIDHHKRYSHLTVLDEEGNTVKTGVVPNRSQDVMDFLEGCQEGSRAVIEAGRASYTMVDILEELGVEVQMAHLWQIKNRIRALLAQQKEEIREMVEMEDR